MKIIESLKRLVEKNETQSVISYVMNKSSRKKGIRVSSSLMAGLLTWFYNAFNI